MKYYIIGQFCTAIILSIISHHIYGQKNQVKFRKPTLEEVSMTQYLPDTSALAAVLYDKGFFSATTFKFTRHTRLKILRKAGNGYANFTVRTPTKSEIEGYTYNLVDGVVTETKLLRGNIYREEIISGIEVSKVFFPDVREGSVVELRYTHSGFPFEWRFQEGIPVAYSELVLEPTSAITFKKTMFGFEKVQEKGINTWVAERMPALKEEPLMGHYANYLTKFKFDVESYKMYGVSYEISTSWEKISERLTDLPGFGGVIRESRFLNEKAAELKNKDIPLVQKITEAYQYIQENIKWNQSSSLLISGMPRSNFKKDHAGNSAEINLLLVSLLKKIGITTYPAILSTRDNGLLNPASASLSSLNYVIAYVLHENVEILLDATLKHPVPGLLPDRCRNVSAWVVDHHGGWWIDLTGGKNKTKKQFVVINLNDISNYTANISMTYENAEFLEWMDEYTTEGTEEAYVKTVKARSRDVEIEECKIDLIDFNKMRSVVTDRVNLNATPYIETIGSELEISPFILTDIRNPFKSEKRRLPIDFIYPSNYQVIVSIPLPEGFSLKAVPESLNLKVDSGGARFTYFTSYTSNILMIKVDLLIERQIFAEAEYGALRSFFSEVNRKLSEPLLLKKRT